MKPTPQGYLFILACALLAPDFTSGSQGAELPDVIAPTPLVELEPHYRRSVLRGWRSFQTSFAADGVACVDCHPGHEAMRLWGGAYPKVQVFDGTAYRVKGLRGVVSEALERHTDLPMGKRNALVEDLVAYIAWWGEGRPVAPGRSRSTPPASEEWVLLRAAVAEGEKLFRRESFGPCGGCHDLGREEGGIGLGRSAARFPRYVSAADMVMSLEAFLCRHLLEEGGGELDPEGEEVTALAAYLAGLAEGVVFRPGSASTDGEEREDEE